MDQFRDAFNAELLAIKGSGWGWLVVAQQPGAGSPSLRIITTKDQDVPGSQAETPVIGIDMWEHAYYLQVGTRPPALPSPPLPRLQQGETEEGTPYRLADPYCPQYLNGKAAYVKNIWGGN